MEPIEKLLGATIEELKNAPQLRGLVVPPLKPIEDQSYISMPDAGISMVFPDNRTVDAIQLHAAGHEGYSAYAAALPSGLVFDMSRAQVRDHLGQPDQQGEEKILPLLGKKPAWDSFARDGYRLHVEYNFGATAIQLVSLMPK